MTAANVLELAGGKPPHILPTFLCRGLVTLGYAVASKSGRGLGLVRRVELMWFGQEQNSAWARSVGYESQSYLSEAFAVRQTD